MDTSTAAPLSQRDRAVLRAVAAGRCQISHADGDGLIVDGLCFRRPVRRTPPRHGWSDLINVEGPGSARLTPSGQAQLPAT
jgi:hypothetical protein